MTVREEILGNMGMKPVEMPAVEPAPGILAATIPSVKPEDAATGTLELNDDMVKEYLKGKGFKDINTLDDLKPKPAERVVLTADQLREQETEEENNAYAYGLKEKKFDSKALNAYHADKNKTPQEIAYNVFKEKQLAKTKDLDEETIKARFDKKFNISEDAEEWEKEEAMQELQSIAAHYMDDKHKAILGVKENYKGHLDASAHKTNYSTAVENAAAKINRDFTFKMKDDDMGEVSYGYKYDDDIVNEVKKEFMADSVYELLSKSGKSSEESLTNSIQKAVEAKSEHRRISALLRAHGSALVAKLQMGRQGILEAPGGAPVNLNGIQNSEAAKVMKSLGIKA